MSPSADGLAPVVVTSQSLAQPPPALFQLGMTFFFAPSGTQFQSLWQAGRNFAAQGGKFSQAGQFIGRAGIYNFQQDSAAQGYGYGFYQDASNLGIGVFSEGFFDGSGLGYIEMTGGGQYYGTGSSNWSFGQAFQWQQLWTAGWNAAASSNFPVQVSGPLQWAVPINWR
jgi:hypothetical protein